MHQITVILLSVATLFCAGCSSSDDCVNESPEALALCSQDTILGIVRLQAQIEEIARVAEGGAPPPTMTWTPASGSGIPPFSWNFVVQFDVTGDFAPDMQIRGLISFSADPIGGIAAGSTATTTYAIEPVQDAAVAVFGDADLQIRFTNSSTIEVRGTTSMEDRLSSCDAAFRFPDATPLTVVFPNDIISGSAPSELAFETLGLSTSGVLDATISAGGATFVGDIRLDGSQDAHFDGDVNGDMAMYELRIFPSDSQVQTMLDCLAEQQIVFFEMTGLVEDVTENFIDNGRALGQMEDQPGLTFTATGSASLLDYTFDLGVYTGNRLTGTMRGQLTVTRDDQLPNGRITTLQMSYNIDAEQVSESIRFAGTNGQLIPFRSEIDVDDEYVYYGTGSIDLFLSCPTTFEVPEIHPLEPDDEPLREERHEAGENAVTVLNQVDTDVVDTLISTIYYIEDGIIAINSKINGISIPATAILDED